MTPNTEIRAFLQAIAAAPDDDTPRLVFADWLDEHDRPDRAEFIRAEVAIARTTPGQAGRARLFARRDALYEEHAAEWFAWFSGKARYWVTERGFVTDITCRPDEFLTHADGWFATQPITRLKLTDVWTVNTAIRWCLARELLTIAHLGQLTHLTLDRAGVNSAGVYWLSRNRNITRLRELNLRDNRITDEAAQTLAGMAGLAALESLDLVGNRITDAGARHLRESPHLHNLRELRLSRNPIGSRAWRELEDRFGRVLVG